MIDEINIEYLEKYLAPHGYQLDQKAETPIFFKRVMHKNPVSLYAFTLIIITLDKYTVSIEGLNEILISRAVKAKAIEINNYEELDALREIVYDDTLDDVKRFELMFAFFEKQLQEVINTAFDSDEQNKALAHLQTMVEVAKSTF